MKFIFQIAAFLCFSFTGLMAYCNDADEICERISGKTAAELRFLRNEIYARHGYIFNSADLKNYFNKQDWYKPDPKFKMEALSESEKECVSEIGRQEKLLLLPKQMKKAASPSIEGIKDITDGMDYSPQLSTSSANRSLILKEDFENRNIPSEWRIEGQPSLSVSPFVKSSSGSLKVEIERGEASIHVALSSAPIMVFEVSFNISDKYLEKYERRNGMGSQNIFSVGIYNTNSKCSVWRSYIQDCSFGGTEIEPTFSYDRGNSSGYVKFANQYTVWDRFAGAGKSVPPNTWNKIIIQTDLVTSMATLWLNDKIIQTPGILQDKGEFSEIGFKFFGPVEIQLAGLKAYSLSPESLYETYVSPSGKLFHLQKGKGV